MLADHQNQESTSGIAYDVPGTPASPFQGQPLQGQVWIPRFSKVRNLNSVSCPLERSLTDRIAVHVNLGV